MNWLNTFRHGYERGTWLPALIGNLLIRRTGLQILIDDGLGNIVESFVLQAHVDGTDPARIHCSPTLLVPLATARKQNPKHQNAKYLTMPNPYQSFGLWRKSLTKKSRRLPSTL